MSTGTHEQRNSLLSKLGWALAGIVATGLGGIILAAAVLEFGLFNVAASTAHLPEVTWFVHRVMIHSVQHRARGISAPASVAPSEVAAGYCEYRAHCQMCHGGPGVARDKWANGVNPPPPYLVDSRARWTTNQLYWIVSNGVKMTAMPAWSASMSNRQIWSVVSFVETAPKLSAGTYLKWGKSPGCPSASDVVAALGPAGTPANLPPSLANSRGKPALLPRR